MGRCWETAGCWDTWNPRNEMASQSESPVSVCAAFGEFREDGRRNNCLRGVQWSPDGSCLLTASEDQQLRIFNLPEEEEEPAGGAEQQCGV